MRNRNFAWVVTSLSLTLAMAVPLHADTMDQLHDCIQDCLTSYDETSWDFYLCVWNCMKDRDAQTGGENLEFDPASTGFGTIYGLPVLHVEPGAAVTAPFAIHSADPLERIDLYLQIGAVMPPSPEFGLLVGSDTDPSDGWAITFDTTDFGDFAGVLIARAQFAGHDEQLDGDQAMIFLNTVLPPDLPPLQPLDIAATGLTVTSIDGGAEALLNYEVAVADDFSPELPIDMTFEINGVPGPVMTLTPSMLAGSFSCYVASTPLCAGGCPINVECKLVRIEVWGVTLDKCMCNLLENVSFPLPAAPGDLIVVRLDPDNSWFEGDESNNVVWARVPLSTAVGGEVPAGFITAIANQPNPFNPRTVFTFSLAAPADVRLEILDARGRRVRSLAAGRCAAGAGQLEWDGRDDGGRSVPSGVYSYRILAGGQAVTGMMALIK